MTTEQGKQNEQQEIWIYGPEGIIRKNDILHIITKTGGLSKDFWNIVAIKNDQYKNEVILYRVSSKSDAEKAMEKIMKQLMPNSQYDSICPPPYVSIKDQCKE